MAIITRYFCTTSLSSSENSSLKKNAIVGSRSGQRYSLPDYHDPVVTLADPIQAQTSLASAATNNKALRGYLHRHSLPHAVIVIKFLAVFKEL